MRKTFLSTVRSVEQHWQGETRVANTFGVIILNHNNHFLQRNIFFKQGIIRYKEWEDQETLIEGLTVLQPEWERNTTQEQKKMKSKTRKDGNLRKRQMFDFYPTCLEKTKHIGIFTPGCFFPHMFGF